MGSPPPRIRCGKYPRPLQDRSIVPPVGTRRAWPRSPVRRASSRNPEIVTSDRGAGVLPLMVRKLALSSLVLSFGVAGCALTPEMARDDQGRAQDRREQVVELIRSGQIAERDEYDNVVLPAGLADASIHGKVDVRDEPFMVFFMTWTGFSPDPYCGYEYVADEATVDPDPLGSGSGKELEATGEGWFWLCAS